MLERQSTFEGGGSGYAGELGGLRALRHGFARIHRAITTRVTRGRNRREDQLSKERAQGDVLCSTPPHRPIGVIDRYRYPMTFGDISKASTMSSLTHARSHDP